MLRRSAVGKQKKLDERRRIAQKCIDTLSRQFDRKDGVFLVLDRQSVSITSSDSDAESASGASETSDGGYQFINNYTKLLVNNILMGLIKSAFGGQHMPFINALVLDERNANTTQAIYKTFGSERCVIDAPNVREEVCEALRRYTNVYSPCCGVEELIEKWEQEYNMVFLDYCGTFDGNQSFCPRNDWKKVCSHINDNNEPIVIGITISIRTNHYRSGSRHGMTGIKATKEIIRIVKKSTSRPFNLVKIGYKQINTLFFQFGERIETGNMTYLFIQQTKGEFTERWNDREKEATQGLPIIENMRLNDWGKTLLE